MTTETQYPNQKKITESLASAMQNSNQVIFMCNDGTHNRPRWRYSPGRILSFRDNKIYTIQHPHRHLSMDTTFTVPQDDIFAIVNFNIKPLKIAAFEETYFFMLRDTALEKRCPSVDTRKGKQNEWLPRRVIVRA